MERVRRGYSRAFPPHGESGKRYMLDDIPAGFWAAVRVKARRDGVSLRALILTLLNGWLTGAIALPAAPTTTDEAA
jgi:hypothetical protein